MVNHNTEEVYWGYVKRLAQEHGIDPEDSDAVRRLDRQRPKKMRNKEWVNLHEPEAKIGPKKARAADMIHKSELVCKTYSQIKSRPSFLTRSAIDEWTSWRKRSGKQSKPPVAARAASRASDSYVDGACI